MLEDASHPWLTATRRLLQAHLVFAQLNWADTWIWLYSPDDYAAAAAQLSDLMISGLGAPSAPWPVIAASATTARAPGNLDDTLERYLEAATRLINRDGYRRASIDRVSAELNLTKGSFYYHLSTKDQLLFACFARTFSLMDAARRTAAPGQSRWSQLVMAVVGLATRQAAGPGGHLLRPPALIAGPPEGRSKHVRHYLQAITGYGALISEAAAKGDVRPIYHQMGAHYVMILALAAGGGTPNPSQMDSATLVEDYLRPGLLGMFVPPQGGASPGRRAT